MTLRAASNEGSSNDAKWGSPTSSFNLPSDARWRWRRKLCLGLGGRPGSTIDAFEWTETHAGEATLDACEAPSGCVGRALPELHGKGGRVRVAPPEREPRGSGQHCFKELGRQRCGRHRLETRRWQRQSECGWHRQAASSAGSTARKRHLDECG